MRRRSPRGSVRHGSSTGRPIWRIWAPAPGHGARPGPRLPPRRRAVAVRPRPPEAGRAWPGRLPNVLDALARVDTDTAVATLLRHEVPADRAQPGRHLRAVSSSLAEEPSLAGVVDWLHDNRPAPPERLGLVHGDLWPGNVFIGSHGIRLIDWTRGGIDDPALDVGFAKVGFVLMPEPFPHLRPSGSSWRSRVSRSPPASLRTAITWLEGPTGSATTRPCDAPSSWPTSSPSEPQASDRAGSTGYPPSFDTWRGSPTAPSPSAEPRDTR